MQLMQVNYNYVGTTIVLVCNYYYNTIMTLFFIHPSMMNFVDFNCNYFSIANIVETH